eukprot:4198141-Prymnesium_polylepis.1
MGGGCRGWGRRHPGRLSAKERYSSGDEPMLGGGRFDAVRCVESAKSGAPDVADFADFAKHKLQILQIHETQMWSHRPPPSIDSSPQQRPRTSETKAQKIRLLRQSG